MQILMKIITVICFMSLSVYATESADGYSYAVVISEDAHSEEGWKQVADSLLYKHAAAGPVRCITWASSVTDAAAELEEFLPDYIGFIARPVIECSSEFIVSVSRLCRTLDSDPYGDATWGIITGHNAKDALRAVTESLQVRTVLCASGNLPFEPPIERFYQAVGMTCDSYTKTDYIFPGNYGKVYTENRRPGDERDRIHLVSQWLSSSALSIEVEDMGSISAPLDCIITGGHGNVNLWQCHYPEAGTEGYMQSVDGELRAAPYSGGYSAITVPTPKIYWCASNCLMGNPDDRDNFVYAAFHSGHAVQMFGFVNNASAGDEFMAWGTYDRVTKRAGKHTLPQGFFLSNNNAQFEIEHPSGLIDTQRVRMFMDSTVLYGDPAGAVFFYNVGDSAHAYHSTLSYTPNNSGSITFTYTFTMNAHNLEYGTGYCYQFRPVEYLPVRIVPQSVVIKKNEGHTAVITDNIMIWELLNEGEVLERGTTRTLTWSADIIHAETAKNATLVKRNPVGKNYLVRYYDNNGGNLLFERIPQGQFSFRVLSINGVMMVSGTGNARKDAAVHLTTGVQLLPGVYIAAVNQNGRTSATRFLVRR